MEPYIYKRNNEGVHIINLSKTWEKLMVAARIIAAIPNPKDVLVRTITEEELVLNEVPLRSQTFPEGKGEVAGAV